MVPPASHKVSRASWYSGCQPRGRPCPLPDSHRLWRRVPAASRTGPHATVGPTTPVAVASPRFGLFPFRSPLLRESRLISFRRATEMFQFTRCPPLCLCVQQRVSRHHSGWVAPFGFSRLIACMQLPLNVSPVSASFIGFQRPGIPHILCVACCFFLICSYACMLTQSSSLAGGSPRCFSASQATNHPLRV